MAKCYVIDMFLKRFWRGWGGGEEEMRSGDSEEGTKGSSSMGGIQA